jgi:hypothetical protein
MYHASYSPDSNIRHYAEYFGLSVVEQKDPKILKRSAQLCVNYKETDIGRIIWGVKVVSKQDEEFTELLKPYLNSTDTKIRKRAETVIQELTEKTDVAAEDFRIRPYPAGGLYTVTVAIRNNGSQQAPSFRLNFYQGDPANNLNLHGKQQSGSHGAGPIKPGNVWNETSSPFALKEGSNEIVVVLDTDQSIAESDETNNLASMTVVVKDGRIIEKSVQYSPQTNQKSEQAEKADAKVEFEPREGVETIDMVKPSKQTKAPSEQRPTNEAVYRHLEKIFDLSELPPEMHFADALDVLKNTVEPPLNVYVFWRDLYEEADVERTSPIHIDSDAKVPLKMAFNLLLDSVSGGFGDLTYTIANGLIYIGPKQSLRKKVKTSVHGISDVIGAAGNPDNISGLVQLQTIHAIDLQSNSVAPALRVNKRMPPVGSKTGVQDDGGEVSFGPVIEEALSGSSGEAIDFDRGTLWEWPKVESAEEVFEWFESTGVDAVGTISPELRGLSGFDMVAFPDEEEKWEMSAAAAVKFISFGKVGWPIPISGEGKLPATYMIRTREGGVGVLQITGFRDDHDEVQFRYKMVVQEAMSKENSTAALGRIEAEEKVAVRIID